MELSGLVFALFCGTNARLSRNDSNAEERQSTGLLTVLFQILIFLAGVALAAFAAREAWRSKRRLDARLRQFRAEQEAQRNTPGAINPYAMLAELYQEDAPENRPVRRSRTKPR